MVQTRVEPVSYCLSDALANGLTYIIEDKVTDIKLYRGVPILAR